MKHYLISNLDPHEILELIEEAISQGEQTGPDLDRMKAEAWLRGWCYDRTTPSFQEALIIFLHNHIIR